MDHTESEHRIEAWLRQADLKVHPYLLACHPSKEEEIRTVLSDSRVLVVATDYVDPDTVVFMDRRKLSLWQDSDMSVEKPFPYQNYFRKDTVENDER